MARFEKIEAYTFNSDSFTSRLPKEIISRITSDPKESLETLFREYLQFTDLPQELFTLFLPDYDSNDGLEDLPSELARQLLPVAVVASVFTQDAFEKRLIHPHLNPTLLHASPVNRSQLSLSLPGDYMLIEDIHTLWNQHHPSLFTQVRSLLNHMTHESPSNPHYRKSHGVIFPLREWEKDHLEQNAAKAYALLSPTAPRMITIPNRTIPTSIPA